MKYYKLSHETDYRVIGTYPQCKGMPSNMGFTVDWFDRPNSFTHLNNEDFPDFIPDFIWELEDNTKLTDVISPSNISARGFLINEKVKEIFSQHNLMEHKFYPAKIIMGNKNLQYYWLHFKENREYFLKNIDYERSSFFIADLAFKRIGDISINSYEDYVLKKKELKFKYISISKLIFNKELSNVKLDMFGIRYLFSDFLASEQFVNAIQSHDVTGLCISEQNFL